MRTNGKYKIFHALAPALAGFCFPSEPNIHAGPEYEYINNISMHGEKFYQLHTETTTAIAIVTSK